LSGNDKRKLTDLRILVVDDEDDLRRGLALLTGSLGADVREAADGEAALRALQEGPADIVITDLRMPRMSGSDLLVEIKKLWPQTEVIILTGFGTIQTAVTCIRRGAAHFLTKPFDNREIVQIVERLGRQIVTSRRESSREELFVADDPAMRETLSLVERAAPSPVPILLEGESGTGKELVAQILHKKSLVADKPFLAVNAAALPDTLLESELFGHAKGAFTGADRQRKGLFEEARGGTVFLDEVESMSPSFQGKLLRVLQEKVVRPLGQTDDVRVSFRLISATNRDLEDLIRTGAFREDLFFRIGVMRIHLPPLRNRPADIPRLAQTFLERAARLCLPSDARAPTLSEEALTALRSHSWPGNVRELENTIQRAVIVSSDGVIRAHHLGLGHPRWKKRDDDQDMLDYNEGKQRAIESFQREFIGRALERSGGNVSKAAESCGMTRAALQRIMRQLGIDRTRFL